MCWACNPVCGRCKPPKQKVATCPECGRMTFFSREEVRGEVPCVCPKCGTNLDELLRVEPVECKASGLMCAWPCGQRDVVPADGKLVECAYRTPVE